MKLMDANGVASPGLLLVKIEKTLISQRDKSLLARAGQLIERGES